MLQRALGGLGEVVESTEGTGGVDTGGTEKGWGCWVMRAWGARGGGTGRQWVTTWVYTGTYWEGLKIQREALGGSSPSQSGL